MSRQYIAAGGIVEEVLSENRSFKSVVHSGGLSNTGIDNSASKVEYLLAAQTLKHKNTLYSLISAALEQINDKSDIDSLFRETNRGVFLVMLYELLFSTHKKIHGGGKVKRLIMDKFAEVIRELLSKDSANYEAVTTFPEEPSSVGALYADVVRELSQPQFVRVNQLKMSIEDGLEYIKTKFSLLDYGVSVTSDELIPSLVRIAPLETVDLTTPHPLLQRPATKARIYGEDEMVKNGHLIMQDKASCFPSQVLFNCWLETQDAATLETSHVHFIDACAAPGNKTSHLAALLSTCPLKSFRISAVELDQQRAQLLQRRMQQAGAQPFVSLRQGDFLQMNPRDEALRDATAILLDPSCSGSGLAQRAVDRLADSPDPQGLLQRVERLRRFQVQALLKAMGFEQVSLIVYSTCSVHLQENEAVVAEALHWQRLGAGSGGGWQLVNPAGFEAWPRRGEALPLDALRCVRYQTKPVKTKGVRGVKGKKGKVPVESPAAAVLSLSDQERAHLLRCFPQLDGTDGFFCAVLRRELPAKKEPLERKKEIFEKTEEDFGDIPKKPVKVEKLKKTSTVTSAELEVQGISVESNRNRMKKKGQIKEEPVGPVSLFAKKRFQVQTLRTRKRQKNAT